MASHRSAADDNRNQHSPTVTEDNMTTQDANQKLLQAARSGKIADAQAALDAGASPIARDRQQQTPLHFAAATGHTDIARLLIENGADPSARDCMRQTPLHWAAASGHADIARLLIENGADPTARDKWHAPPLHWAAENGHTDLMIMFEDAAKDKPGHAANVAKRRGSDDPQIGG
jgi:ankyrin repeat protein